MGVNRIGKVQITGGTHDAPPLRRIPGRGNPVIKSKPSQLQEIIEAAPELVNRVISLVDRANLLLGDANQKNFAEAMANVSSITGSFASGSDDIRTLLSDGASAVTELQAASADARILVKELRETIADLSKCPSGDFMSRMNRLSGGPS